MTGAGPKPPSFPPPGHVLPSKAEQPPMPPQPFFFQGHEHPTKPPAPLRATSKAPPSRSHTAGYNVTVIYTPDSCCCRKTPASAVAPSASAVAPSEAAPAASSRPAITPSPSSCAEVQEDIKWPCRHYELNIPESVLSPGWQVIGPMPGLHVKYVSVHTLDPESWAGKQGVSLGDRIVAINDGDVSALSFQELSKQMCK